MGVKLSERREKEENDQLNLKNLLFFLDVPMSGTKKDTLFDNLQIPYSMQIKSYPEFLDKHFAGYLSQPKNRNIICGVKLEDSHHMADARGDIMTGRKNFRGKGGTIRQEFIRKIREEEYHSGYSGVIDKIEIQNRELLTKWKLNIDDVKRKLGVFIDRMLQESTDEDELIPMPVELRREILGLIKDQVNTGMTMESMAVPVTWLLLTAFLRGEICQLENYYLCAKVNNIQCERTSIPYLFDNNIDVNAEMRTSASCSTEIDNTPSLYSFDRELNEKFMELFDLPKESKKNESLLREKILEIKSRNFIKALLQKIEIDNSQEDANNCFDNNISLVLSEYRSCRGKHFTIPDLLGFKTILFEIYKNIDYKTKTKFFTCKPVYSIQQKSEDGLGKETIYYIDDPQVNGNRMILLHFNNDDNEVFINQGILYGDKVFLSKKPIPFTFQFSYFDDQLNLNSATFNTANILDEKRMLSQVKEAEVWYDTDVDELAPVIVDPETAVPIQRELYYDEKVQKWKAKIKIATYKNYFVFQLRSENNNLRETLSDFEIAKCFQYGDCGFPKNIMEAVSYYEKDGTAQSLYEIAVMFRSDKSICDDAMYTEYLKQATELGCEAASVEYALCLCESVDSNDRDRGRCILMKKTKESSGISFFVLGYLIESGIINGSIDVAFEYYYHACVHGYEPAFARLGLKKHIQLEKKVDFLVEKLRKNYMMNLEYGITIAKYSMGCILYYGFGISPNKPKGLELLIDSAEQGNEMAVYALFDIYCSESQYKDDAQLLSFLKNIKNFDISAINEFANRLLDGVGYKVCDKNDILAFKLLQEVAKTGDQVALHNLGWAYKEGRGCSVDYEKAQELFRKAGKADSLYHLGDIYERGLGVEKNLVKAMFYYEKGVENGSEKAKNRLNEIDRDRIRECNDEKKNRIL